MRCFIISKVGRYSTLCMWDMHLYSFVINHSYRLTTDTNGESQMILPFVLLIGSIGVSCIADSFSSRTSSMLYQSITPKTPSDRLNRRQDTTLTTSATSTVENVPTTTTDSATPTKLPLTVATTPVPLANTIGLIMPNPWQPLYVGKLVVSYSSNDEIERSLQASTIHSVLSMLYLDRHQP